jgi:hypothetical protein
MAATTDLGEDNGPALPLVGIRLTGEIGEPLVVVPGAILTPDAAVSYAQRIFAAAASACAQARLDVAGHG